MSTIDSERAPTTSSGGSRPLSRNSDRSNRSEEGPFPFSDEEQDTNEEQGTNEESQSQATQEEAPTPTLHRARYQQ